MPLNWQVRYLISPVEKMSKKKRNYATLKDLNEGYMYEFCHIFPTKYRVLADVNICMWTLCIQFNKYKA